MEKIGKSNFVEMVLTCGSWQEAQQITDALIEKRLVACVEQLEIKAKNWWHGKHEEGKEIKLIMLSMAEKFDEVEKVVRKHHSYETFVLQMLPITRLNADAAKWLSSET